MENPQQNNGNEIDNQVTLTTKENHETKDIADNNNSGLREVEVKREEIIGSETSVASALTISTTSQTLISVKEEYDKDLINALPIQDYLLSSEEEEENSDKAIDNKDTADDNKETIRGEKEKHNSIKDISTENNDVLDTNEDNEDDEIDAMIESDILLDKFSASNKIVDELDALRKKKKMAFLLKSQHGSNEQQTFVNQPIPSSSQLQSDSNHKVIQSSSSNNDKQQQQSQLDPRKRKLEKKEKK